MSRLLTVRALRAGYGDLPVLHGLDLHVDAGEVVVLLGANGAGKTTTLRALSGMLPAGGQAVLDGRSGPVEVLGADTAALVRQGIAHVPQGRGTLADLTVADNLRAGALVRRGPARRARAVAADLERWFSTFPALAARRDAPAGTLSGGEQQMLAIARACMSRPRLLLLDEPSLGLAPLVVREVLARVRELVRATPTDTTRDATADATVDPGTAVLLVEQNVALALGTADRGYVLEAGRIVAAGSAAELTDAPAVRRAYLGV